MISYNSIQKAFTYLETAKLPHYDGKHLWIGSVTIPQYGFKVQWDYCGTDYVAVFDMHGDYLRAYIKEFDCDGRICKRPIKT